MKAIAANAWKLFTRNKGFFYVITIQPIFVFLLMSFLLPYSTTHNIAFLGSSESAQSAQVEDALKALEGINLIDVPTAEVDGKLMSGNIEIAVFLHEDGSVEMRSLGGSEVESAVTLCVKRALSGGSYSHNTVVNEAPEKGLSLANSLGFMIYKTLTAGNILAALIINERNKKMKDRILLSGTKAGSYLGGVSLVYLFFMMIGSVVYYLAAMALRFDFGMRNSLGFLLVLLAANVLSTAMYLFMSTIFKREESLWFLATFILTPMGLFSGLLFPYEFMPETMQAIGSFFPHRWIASGIEKIQTSGTIAGALPELSLILGLSVGLFLAAALRSRLKGRHIAVR